MGYTYKDKLFDCMHCCPHAIYFYNIFKLEINENQSYQLSKIPKKTPGKQL
jgi:hypothetical protein